MECALVWLDQLHHNYLIPQEVTQSVPCVSARTQQREAAASSLAPEAASLCQPWSRRTSSEASNSQVSSCTAFKMYEKHIALEKHCGRWQLRLIYAQIGIKAILKYYSQKRHVHTDLHWNKCQNKWKHIFVILVQGASRQALVFGTTVEEIN